MMVLQVNKILTYKSAPWNNGESDSPEGGRKPRKFYELGGGKKHETGSALYNVTLLEGKVESGADVIIIGSEVFKGKVVNFKKKLLGNKYDIEIEFDDVFSQGLEKTIAHFVMPSAGIVGFVKEDKEAFKTYEGQQQLLKMLLHYTIPNKEGLLFSIAEPCYSININNGNNPLLSHFLGSPKFDFGTELPIDEHGNSLIHLANLNIQELIGEGENSFLQKFLSFYINVKKSGDAMPTAKEDFKVLNYNFASSKDIETTKSEITAVNFDLTPFLDIPKSDHSILLHIGMQEEEIETYATVAAIYKDYLREVISNKLDGNKLFGFPENVEGCVALEAEALDSKRNSNDVLPSDATEWKLLLEVSPSDHRFAFFDTFGDREIYFMIKKNDLAEGNFDNVQVVVQNARTRTS